MQIFRLQNGKIALLRDYFPPEVVGLSESGLQVLMTVIDGSVLLPGPLRLLLLL